MYRLGTGLGLDCDRVVTGSNLNLIGVWFGCGLAVVWVRFGSGLGLTLDRAWIGSGLDVFWPVWDWVGA